MHFCQIWAKIEITWRNFSFKCQNLTLYMHIMTLLNPNVEKEKPKILVTSEHYSVK